MSTTTTTQERREACVQQAIKIARVISRLHHEFNATVCDPLTEREQDGVLEPEANDLFHRLIEKLWEVARGRAVIADDDLPPVAGGDGASDPSID